MVKCGTGSSRKRKVVSSSESDYDAEMDGLNIIPPESMKVDGKKGLLIVEDVLVEKYHFIFQALLRGRSSFTIRGLLWKES